MPIDVSTLTVKVKGEGIDDTAKDLNKIFHEAGKAERRVKTLTESVDKLSNVFRSGTASANAYQQAVANANRSVGGHDAATGALTAAMRQLTGAMGTLSGHLSTMPRQVHNNTTAMRANTVAMRDAHAAARGLAGSLGVLWMTYGNMVPLAAGLALGASFRQVIKVGAELEHTLTSIRVKGMETVASVDAMRQSIYDLGEGIHGPLKVAEAFQVLVLAGLNAKQALSSVNAALNLAVAGDISIEKAASTLVQVGTAMGYSAEGYSIVADIIAKTAAVSMSSVESLSGSFKSAAVVGSLYGATLVDVGTSLAALSQLGISHTAAGTSLKNMYKELGSNADRVKSAFKDMKMSPSDIKDAKGDFLDIVEVFEKLDAGLKKVAASKEKDVIARMTNERGVKQFMANLELIRTKIILEDGTISNALRENQKKIIESYGFAAISAVQMTMTTKNQMSSVMNTLQTSLAKVFRDIEPSMNVFSARMKGIFSSAEFRDAIASMAKIMATLAIAIADNLPLLAKFAAGLLAIKAAMIGQAIWASMAAGISAVGAAIAALTAGTIGLSVALPALAVVLAVATAAWAAYNLAKGRDDASVAKENAEAYGKNYIEGLIKEAERLDAVTQKMKEKKDVATALLEVEKDQARQEMSRLQNESLRKAVEKQDKARGALGNMSDSRINEIAQNGGNKWVNEYLNAKKEVEKVQQNNLNQTKLAIAAEETLARIAKDHRTTEEATIAAQRRAADDAAKVPDGGGNGKLSGIQNEIIALARLKASYDAQARALATYTETEIKQMKGVEFAKVAAALAEGKYADAKSQGFIARLKQIAIAADEAKFERDKFVAIAEMKEKISEKMAEETAALDAANKGHSKFTGILGVEVEQMQKIWKLDAANPRDKKLLDEAQALGVLIEQRERAQKFNKGTANIETKASSLIEEADALMLYGEAGRQTALQLAELKIKQEGLNPALSQGAIEARLSAAAFEDIAQSYKNVAKTVATLAEENKQAEASILADILDSEAEKVLAKDASARAQIETNLKVAESAYLTAVITGTLTDAQVDGYFKLQEASKQAFAELDKKRSIGLAAAKLKDMDKAIGGISSGASSMEKAFGRVGKAIGGMAAAYGSFAKSRVVYDQQMAAASKLNGEDRIRAEQAAQEDLAISQVRSYGQMFQAAQGFFKEGSKGYKAMEAAAKVMHAAEAALMIVKGINAVLTQGEGDPYSAFARMAAMTAMVAALGVAIGGSGSSSAPTAKSRQETQGRGTVLGDVEAQSESISNSFKRLQEDSRIDLKYTSAMAASLKKIENSMGGLAAIIYRSTGITTGEGMGVFQGTVAVNKGDPLMRTLGIDDSLLSDIAPIVGKLHALWGKTKQKVTDSGLVINGALADLAKGAGISEYYDIEKTKSSFFGLSKKKSNSTMFDAADPEIAKQFGMIFQGISDTLNTAATALGLDTTKVAEKIAGFIIDIPRSSLKDLKGDELQEALSAIISTASDDLSRKAFPGFDSFNKVGEGYYETVIRVASGVEVASAALEDLGITAVAYTAITEKQGDVAAEIVRESLLAVEKLGEVTTGVGGIVKVLSGTAEEIAETYKQLKNLQNLMSETGLNGNNLTVDMIRGAGSLESLETGVKDYFSNFFTAAEKSAIEVRLLNNEFTTLGIKSIPTTKEAFKELVNASNDGTEAGDKLVGNLMTIAGRFATVTDEADEAAKKLKDFGIELSLLEADNLIAAVEAAIEGLERSVDAEKTKVTKAASDEIEALRKKSEAEVKSKQDELKATQESQKAIQTIFDSLKNALKSTVVESVLLTRARRQEAQNVLLEAKAHIQSGQSLTTFKGLDDALAVIAKPSVQLHGTFEEYARDQAQTAKRINELSANAKIEVDKAQVTIDAINNTITAIQESTERTIKSIEKARDDELFRLDSIVTNARAELEALLGIDNSVKSLGDAIRILAEAMAAAKNNPVVAATDDITKAYEDNLGRAPEQAGMDHWKGQVAGGTPISQVVSNIATSPEALVQGLYQSLLKRRGSMAEVSYWQNKLLSGTSIDEVRSAFLGSDEYKSLPSFDVGTNYVPYDMPANIHRGERIVPAADNAELMTAIDHRRTQSAKDSQERAALIAAVNNLERCIMTGDVANVQQTKEIVKIVRKWDGEGIPEERDVTV